MGKDLFSKLIEAGDERDKYRGLWMVGKDRIDVLERECGVLGARIAELEAVISGYEDTINERDRENAVLKAQMVAVNRWATQVGNGHFNFDPVCPTERLRAVLSSAVAPLAVVEAQAFMVGDVFVQWVLDTEWREQTFNIAHPDRDLSGYSSTPVTVVVLSREGE